MPLLEGKNALIFGIANHRSIGWAIAQSLAGEGARLAFTYQDRMEKYVRELAAKIPDTPVFPCDVQNDEQNDHRNQWNPSRRGILPIARGRKPRGSRAAKTRSELSMTSENAPSTRRSASAIASGNVCSLESAIR